MSLKQQPRTTKLWSKPWTASTLYNWKLKIVRTSYTNEPSLNSCSTSKNKTKIHKTNQNMVNVLSNLSIAMCHAFICDKTFMPPPLNFDSKQSSEKGAPMIWNNKLQPRLQHSFQVWLEFQLLTKQSLIRAFLHTLIGIAISWYNVHTTIRFWLDTLSMAILQLDFNLKHCPTYNSNFNLNNVHRAIRFQCDTLSMQFHHISMCLVWPISKIML